MVYEISTPLYILAPSNEVLNNTCMLRKNGSNLDETTSHFPWTTLKIKITHTGVPLYLLSLATEADRHLYNNWNHQRTYHVENKLKCQPLVVWWLSHAHEKQTAWSSTCITQADGNRKLENAVMCNEKYYLGNVIFCKNRSISIITLALLFYIVCSVKISLVMLRAFLILLNNCEVMMWLL